MTWKFYHNPQCSKSREALEFLRTQGIDFQTIEYLKTPPSPEELRVLISQLDSSLSSLVRVKESDFVAAPFDVNSTDEVVVGLTANLRLMERPVLQGHGKATIGRPLEKFLQLLTKYPY
jgi:arsenate reductase